MSHPLESPQETGGKQEEREKAIEARKEALKVLQEATEVQAGLQDTVSQAETQEKAKVIGPNTFKDSPFTFDFPRDRVAYVYVKGIDKPIQVDHAHRERNYKNPRTGEVLFNIKQNNTKNGSSVIVSMTDGKPRYISVMYKDADSKSPSPTVAPDQAPSQKRGVETLAQPKRYTWKVPSSKALSIKLKGIDPPIIVKPNTVSDGSKEIGHYATRTKGKDGFDIVTLETRYALETKRQ